MLLAVLSYCSAVEDTLIDLYVVSANDLPAVKPVVIACDLAFIGIFAL
jgi:hypothetical protein